MELNLTADDETFVAETRRFLGKESAALRRDPALVAGPFWQRCADLGWFGLAVDANHGGGGGGSVHEALLFREIGRSLLPGPFVGTVLGARLASEADSREVAGKALLGSLRIAVAEPVQGPIDLDARGRLSGRLLLFDAEGADLALVVSPAACALLEVNALAQVTAYRCIDEAVGLAAADARACRTVMVMAPPPDHVLARASVAVAAALAGLAEATRDAAVAHATTRVQFGRPIGAHQAVKHACADMAVRAEAAWAQTIWAAARLDQSAGDEVFHAAAAKAIAADAALANAAANVQVHGGMGFSWECDAHRYLKRARVYDRILGTRRSQLERAVAAPPSGS